MPRKRPNPLDDAVGTPKTAKKTSRVFTRKKATPKPKVDLTPPDEKLDSTPLRFRNGVAIPQYPLELRDPQLGERTPAVVQWYKENHPEAYAALYEGRQV